MSPAEGPVQLGLLNLEGDEQADPGVHGGPDKAVCVYAAGHLAALAVCPALAARWRAHVEKLLAS